MSNFLNIKAPQFSLKDSTGKVWKLKDLLGKSPILLIFYPGDDTPGCTKQLCALQDDKKKFDKYLIQRFGVNQGDANSHNKFINKFGYEFPLLIDTGRKVSKKYGAIKYMFGHESIKRSVIIIDPKGIIRYVKRGLPENSEILNEIKKLIG